MSGARGDLGSLLMDADHLFVTTGAKHPLVRAEDLAGASGAGTHRALLGLCSLISVAVGGFWVLSSLPVRHPL